MYSLTSLFFGVISYDPQLGSYVLLATLSTNSSLTSTAIKAIVRAMATSARHVQTRHFVDASLALCGSLNGDQTDEFDEKTRRRILSLK